MIMMSYYKTYYMTVFFYRSNVFQTISMTISVFFIKINKSRYDEIISMCIVSHLHSCRVSVDVNTVDDSQNLVSVCLHITALMGQDFTHPF